MNIALTVYFMSNLCLAAFEWARLDMAEVKQQCANMTGQAADGAAMREAMTITCAITFATLLLIGWPLKIYHWMRGGYA